MPDGAQVERIEDKPPRRKKADGDGDKSEIRWSVTHGGAAIIGDTRGKNVEGRMLFKSLK